MFSGGRERVHGNKWVNIQTSDYLFSLVLQDEEFDSVGSFLQGTMGRLSALTKEKHHRVLSYVLTFCFCVMLVAWFIVRFR